MELHEAIELIRPAVGPAGGIWADLGAGKGTFTRALAQLLGPRGRVLAVERDDAALRSLRRLQTQRPAAAAEIRVVTADVRDIDAVPELVGDMLDGVVLGNLLHFLPDASGVLDRVAAQVRHGGRVVVIEYDGVSSSRWVPYPVPVSRFFSLASSAGLVDARVVGERRSMFRGSLYCATATRPAATPKTPRVRDEM